MLKDVSYIFFLAWGILSILGSMSKLFSFEATSINFDQNRNLSNAHQGFFGSFKRIRVVKITGE